MTIPASADPGHRLDAGSAGAPGEASPPLSIYVHIPWCVARCGYCDFNTYVTDTTNKAVTSPYVDAMVAEIHQAAAHPPGHGGHTAKEVATPGYGLGTRQVSTVYFGGGTPTLMAVEDVERVLAAVRACFTLHADAEISMEANPETLTPMILHDLRALGINRLSLGMQSALPHVLATLDRRHTPGRVREVVQWARRAGFANLSLDLIYGTPGESMSDWEDSLGAALSMEPDHISAYSLIIEDGTPLARRMAGEGIAYPDEDDLAEKYRRADELFEAASLGWYEVSNWASPGRECQHNLGYWRGGDWLGVGAGAHSHVGGVRWWNTRHSVSYSRQVAAEGAGVAGSERLTDAQARMEAIMLGIRLVEGLDIGLLTLTEKARADEFVARGDLVRVGGRLVCTQSGRLIADGIVRQVLD